MNKNITKKNHPLRIAVLGSGSGTNCQSIIDAIASGNLNAEIVCVLSDVEDALILERARKHDIPAEFISGDPFKTKIDGQAEENYLAALRKYDAEIIALAGFMRIIKSGILETFCNRIINIHPALLPAFQGLDGPRQALEYGAKVAGCTVHFVDEGTDTGPIIIQKAVPVKDDDTRDSLHARIQVQEHLAYPEALRLIANGEIEIRGRRVIKMTSE